MKHSILSILFILGILSVSITPIASASSEFFSHAETLANNRVIQHQDSERGYRLGDTISRAEAMKIALISAGVAQRNCLGLTSFSFTDINTSLGDLCGYIEGAVQSTILSQSTQGVKFLPNKPITRGDFADSIVRSFDITSGSLMGSVSGGQIYFIDVPASLPSSISINRLATTGCINTNTVSFRPYANISRGEAFKIMSCLVGKKNEIKNITTTTTSNEADVSRILEYLNNIINTITTTSTPTSTGAFSITSGPLAGHYSSILQFCDSDAVKALPGKVYSDGSVGKYPSVSINGRTICYAGSFPIYQATSPDFIPTPTPTNLPANCTIKDIDWEPGLSLLTDGTPTQTTNRGQMTAFRLVMPARAGSRSGVYYSTVPTQISISMNPCEWTNESIKTGCASVGSDPQTWNNSVGDPSMCMLTPGVTYYFNVRNAGTWNGPDTCPTGQACSYKFSW